MKRPMTRVVAWLTIFGFAAPLVSWPLWHVARPDASACIGHLHPCDPAIALPFAYEALGLDLAGMLALLVVATWLVAIGIRGVIRHDARIRAARRAQG
jgi:hypothetical protein